VKYRIYKPRPALAPWIFRYECFDSGVSAAGDLTAESQNPAIAVMPDIWPVMGFQYRGRVSTLIGREESSLDTAGITGLQSALRRYRYSPGTGTVLVRFQPWGASAFLPLPMSEIVDCNVGLADVLPQSRVREMQEKLDACAESHALESSADLRRIAVIEGFLLSCLVSRTPDGLLRRSVRLLQAQAATVHDATSLALIAEQLGIGERQLERKFKEWVGFGPKKFARLLRFRQALERLHDAPQNKLNVLSAGFYDPSHLNKEIKAFTGLTPDALARLGSA
jgi:AraC-like DNA-binding protein